MNKNVYFDRYGNKKFLEDKIGIEKKGFYVVLIANEKILMTYPPNVPNCPEFPGGSVLRGEDFRKCLYRTLYQEAGIEFMLDSSSKVFQQNVNFFADDLKPVGEFWIYNQTFFVYDALTYGFDTNKEKWKTPGGAMAEWVPIEDIFSGNKKINFAHWQAVQGLFKDKLSF